MARADPASQSDLVDQYVSILKQITEHRLPREFDHHRMPAPWIQIKLLQLLATLGSNDKRASEAMYEVLGECMRRADTGTNIGYAVVYEVVKTITTIWPDATLLDAAASAISRFITSDSYNLKYLGVTGLAAVVRECVPKARARAGAKRAGLTRRADTRGMRRSTRWRSSSAWRTPTRP
jgi:AP-4 complex subunit epsilon-1